MAVNKTMINEFLNKQRQNALDAVDAQFKAQIKAIEESILSDKESDLYKSLDKIADAVIIYHKEFENIKNTFINYYHDDTFRFSRSYIASESYSSKEELMMVLAELYYTMTDDYRLKSDSKFKMRKEVNAQYDNVSINMKKLKAPKAVEYLEELGFNTEDLKEEKKESFLTVPVETKYLLINKGSSAV